MTKHLTKVCGLTRAEDMDFCHQNGIDFVGMIFVKKSPRFIAPAEAARLPSGAAKRVGVFAGADVQTIKAIYQEATLDLIQLHGGEEPDFCRQFDPAQLIKVLWPERLSHAALVAELARFAPVCAYFLLDAGATGGGSGHAMKSAVWETLRTLQTLPCPRPWLLAGGIGPENLQAALRECAPDGLDLNSALETAPGVKDAALMQQAFAKINAFDASNS